MENLELYNKVREVPQDAKKTISAGRIKGFTDINPMWRIKCLTEQFGPCGIGWYYKTVEKWTETVGDETCAFVMIELYVLYDGKWSQPISGTGGSRLATNERSGVYVSDECYKMATTDALSVACKNLGIGADVYWKEGKTKYDQTGSASNELSNTDISALRSYMKTNGLDEKKVLEKYRLTSISQLTIGNVKAITDPKNLEYFQRNCGE
ncbi:hypothetical protein DXA08_09305 [Blautia obeum]|jgi:hypothetical protein|nr:hypothetical protein DXA08_09305 [Blautia obeum]